MKKIILLSFTLFIVAPIFAFPSWMGNQSYIQNSASQDVTFTIWQNQDYVGLHCEVGVSTNGGTNWIVYQMSYSNNTSGNSVWTLTQKINSSQNCLCYFHGYDDWGGSTYSANYPFIVNPTTANNGNWSTSETWCDGSVPTSTTANYIIAHNVTLDQDATVGSLTINSGATFTSSDETSRIITISNNSSATTLSNSGTWANGSGGSTVIFTGTSESADIIHTISGTIKFQNITINKISGSTKNVGASFGTGSTITGTLEIGTGGYVSTAPPTSFYNNSAILKFNQGSGATYEVNATDNSWSTTEVPQNITITSGTVNLNANRTATGNLLIDGGALVLKNANSTNLTIKGNWTRSSGSFTPNDGTVTLGGTSDGTMNITDGGTAYNLVIDKTGGAKAILASSLTTTNLTINAGSKLTLNLGKTLTATNFTIKSDLNGTGTFKNSGTLSVSGTSKVQQYLTNQSWYLTSPVQGTVTPTNLSRIQGYNEGVGTGNDWSVSGTTMTAGKGYITSVSAAPNTVEFTGTINSGNFSIDLTRHDVTDANKYGFNLIGNPYTAYLDWKAVSAANSAKMPTLTMWYRTKVSGSWNFSTVNGSGVASPANVSHMIPPMQAFWVRASTVGNSTLYLTNDMVFHDDNATNKLKAPSSSKAERQIVRLQVSNATNTDELVIYTDADASNGYDRYDSPKFEEENTVTQIYTTAGTEKLVINGMNSIPLDTEISLGFVPGDATTFSLKANEISNLPLGVKVILKDNGNNGVETDLTNGVTTYDFAPATTTGNRFSVIFRSPGVIDAIPSAANDQNLLVYRNANNQIAVQIKGQANDAYTLNIYNSVGQRLASKQAATGMTVMDVPQAGVYFVTIKGNGVNTTKKVAID